MNKTPSNIFEHSFLFANTMSKATLQDKQGNKALFKRRLSFRAEEQKKDKREQLNKETGVSMNIMKEYMQHGKDEKGLVFGGAH